MGGRKTGVTVLLARYRGGDNEALGELMSVIYDELRGMARAQLRRGMREYSLSATGLVSEAYLSLQKKGALPVHDREHFIAVAGQAMRWVLLDRWKLRKGLKRGGGIAPVEFDERFHGVAGTSEDLADLKALDEALARMSTQDERLARTVELRFMRGLSVDETAKELGVSAATVKRDLQLAKSWLRRELNEDEAA